MDTEVDGRSVPPAADSYEPPSLAELGTLEELTKGGGPNDVSDVQELGFRETIDAIMSVIT